MIGNSAEYLAEKAILKFKVRLDNIDKVLSKNPIIATALNEYIGYKKAAIISKKAYEENMSVVDVAVLETNIEKAKLVEILDPKKLTLL